MSNPMIQIPSDVVITDIIFPSRKVHISNSHTVGTAWLLTRKTIWNLDHNFGFTIKLSNGQIYTVIIRNGFKTDLASTPKPIWWIYPPFDERYGAPALGHDIFYCARIFPKWFNDEFLRKGMEVCGATHFDQTCFKLAVKSCGWMTYKSHTEESITNNRKYITILRKHERS